LPREPRAIITASAPEASRDDHRDVDPLGELARQGIVGLPLVLGRGRARVEADRRDSRIRGQSERQVEALSAARLAAGAKLHRHRHATALPGGDGDPHGEILVREQSGAGAGLADLADGAAHVDVDQIGACLRDHSRRRSHDLRILAEELNRDGVLVGMQAEQLAHGALIAVVEPEARNHL
jgi:hypothetical protein